MFYPISRVTPVAGGLRFYEKDILLCQYLLTGNATIEIEASFMAPGLGVAFVENSSDPLSPDSGFLAKVGYNDCTVLQRFFATTAPLKHSSCLLAPPVSSMKIRFCKEGRTLSIVYNGDTIAVTTMPYDLDEFRFGIYSNAGNTIKKVTVYLDAPDEWLSEIGNADGGILYFKRNKIEMDNSDHDIEVEARPVVLTPGEYYLGGDYSGNVKPYVFPTNSESEDDDNKNILDGKAFLVKETGEYSLKLKGTNGTAENLSISTDENSTFVATTSGSETVEGSYLTFKLDGVKEVKWTGIINSVHDGDYAIIDTAMQKFKLSNLDITLGETYEYDFNVATLTLSIHGQNYAVQLGIEENLKIFRNVNGIITSAIVIDNEGKENNILLRTTQKTYIPASIAGPILVVDANNLPYDLSSSYRVKNGEYIFTNYEREVFDPNTENITPVKKINEAMMSLKMYGIRSSCTVNEEALYEIGEDDTIKAYAPQFELIDPAKYAYKYGSFEIDESIKEYKQVVLDYLKDRSYCINYNEELDSYEVDISSTGDNFHILTDSGEHPYLVTSFKPDSSKFIVLAKEV